MGGRTKNIEVSVTERVVGMLLAAVLALTVCRSSAQTNPYRYGTPHYWMAEAVMGVNAGKFDVAYANLQKASEGYKNIGDVSLQVNALGAMGNLKVFLGEWLLAQQHFQTALAVAKEAGDDGAYSNILTHMLPCYKSIGDFDVYNRYVSQFDSLCAESRSATVKTLYHAFWASEYVSQHEYAMAEHHMRQCWDALQELPLVERENGKLSYYLTMMNFAQQQKDYDNAIIYAKKYVAQSEVVNGKYSNPHLQAYNLLATLYTEAGDCVGAFAVLDSLGRGVGLPGQDSSLLATFYNSKGTCHAKFGELDKAIECFDKSLELLRDIPTQDSPTKLNGYNCKAGVLFGLKRFDEAYETFLNSVEACKVKYGSDSGGYYQALATLANIEAERGNKDRADSLLCVSLGNLLDKVKPLWSSSTPSQHEQYWKELLDKLNGVASFSFKFGVDTGYLTEISYNALLFTKALMLETEKTVIDILTTEGTESDVENYRQLMALNCRLLSLRRNYEYNKGEIDSLLVVQRNLERQLTDRCRLYSEYESFLDMDYHKVKGQLKKNEVLIDFSDYQTEDSIRQYVAYLVDADSKSPLLVNCFVERQLDTLLCGAPKYVMYDYEMVKDGAAEIFWKPFCRHVPQGATVYYVPSGVMHEVALESLPMADGTLLGQHYSFVRLSSAREIEKRHYARPAGKTATLYGDLDYDVPSETLKDESQAYDKTALSWVFRSEYGKEGFGRLRKSKAEIASVGEILSGDGYEVKSYSGVKGNAESFVALSGHSPAILHLATHGFYYTPTEADKHDCLKGYTDAMSLSGLVFSGGNAAWLGRNIPKGVLGGILTARDISNLNFKGTGLVVLSACKTAQGQVTAEGLYGLQRAFKKAGAETLIMTLWQVRDTVAQTFATMFYKELVACGGDKRIAFVKAKSLLRKKYESPFDWACFVMVD